MDSDSELYLCALSRVFAYHCAAGRALLEHLGSPAAVFAASRRELSTVLIHAGQFIDRLLDPQLLRWAREETAWARDHGVRLLGCTDPDYPRRLQACDDAPLMLYCKGGADLNPDRALAVVGTRKASWYGRQTCRQMVGALSGLDPRPAVVSGLALGIDGTAHLAALEAGLPTIAVLPCGIDTVYPRQHAELARRIEGQGALVTDFQRGTSPIAYTFLRRNRIIAGMADATLLAESYKKGGGLITVSLAESYGRDVFAVPGRCTDPSFEGCNSVIASGQAALAADADTIPVAMGWAGPLRAPRRPEILRPGDGPLCREMLLSLQGEGPAGVEEMASRLKADPREVGVILLELEMEGRIGSDGTKFFLSL